LSRHQIDDRDDIMAKESAERTRRPGHQVSPMRRLCFIATLFLALDSVAQLSVEWNFSDFAGKPEQIRKVVIRPLAAYGIWGTNIVGGDRRTFVTGSHGGILVSNIYPGAYQVKLFGNTAVTTFTNVFPADLMGLVNAADYLVVSTNLPGGQYAYSAAVSDARYMTNSTSALAGGVLTLTDTDGNYGWRASAGNAEVIGNNQVGLTLEGTFSGQYSGDGSGLTNVLGMNVLVNYSQVPCTNFSRFILAGFGDPNANGTYSLAGQWNGDLYFTNGRYMLVSNLLSHGRWGVTNNGVLYYSLGRTNANGYPIPGICVTVSGIPPAGTFNFVTGLTNGNGFVEVNSSVPVLYQDGNSEARVESSGSDVTGRIGFAPVMPFASIDGVTRYLTNNLGDPTNNGVILIGAGSFPPATIPLLSGQSIIGLGKGVSIIQTIAPSPGVFAKSLYLGLSNMLIENVTLNGPINNHSYGVGCTNLTLIDVDVGTLDQANVQDGIFSERGNLDGVYNLTAERCHFASTWDITASVVTGTFYDCRMDTVGGPLNNGSGLHPYTVGLDNSFYIIHGGEANVINGPAIATSGGLPANACVWITATNANVRLFGPRLNHYGTNGVDYAIYNLYGNTNIIGWYFDNGVLTYVNGTNYWTNTPPPGWPPARLFDHY
jgi:hypothetical protein